MAFIAILARETASVATDGLRHRSNKCLMVNSQSRFDCRPEPDGTWTVWDNVAGSPAMLGGHPLAGRTHERAEAARDILVRIYQNRLDAQSSRKEPL